MQVSLRNKDRVSWIMIGNYLFSYDDDVHEMHLDELSNQEFAQLVYNWQRGVFTVSEPETLLKAIEDAQNAVIQESVKKEPVEPKPKPTTIIDHTIAEAKELKSLLNKRVTSIQKEAKSLNPSKLRKLLELESNSKKPRKSLVGFLDNMCALNRQHVADTVGSQDVQLNKMDYTGVMKQGMDERLNLDNLTDVVESELEQIVLNPLGEKEDK
jgi:hypothetical protein